MTDFHYTMCGLDNIYLTNGYKIEETEYGQGVVIQDIDGLHKAICRTLINKENRLTGKEFRFLRKEIHLSQHAISKIIGMDEQTVARIEKEETKATVPYEATIRSFVSEVLFSDKAEIKALLEAVQKEEDSCDIRMTDNSGVWKKVA